MVEFRSLPPRGRLALLVLALCFFAFLALAVPASAGDGGQNDAVLIRNVRLIDFAGDDLRVRDHHSVLVRDRKIAAVEPAGQLTPAPGTQIIEGRGKTLVPGLTDMHVHIWDQAELGAYLASGVTTVRNMSGMPFLLELSAQVDRGALAGPRILTTGPILNSSGPNAQLNHQIVETAEEARAAVRDQFEQGYRRIKVYSNLRRLAYEAIRDEAMSLGVPVTGHTPEGVRFDGIPHQRPFDIPFDELLDDPFESIEHVESIVWHGMRNRHDAKDARALARQIAQAEIVVDPTLIAFANLVRIAQTKGAHLRREGTETLNPFVRSMETAQAERWSKEDAKRAQDQLAFYIEFTRMLAEEEVTLVAGSDAGIATNIPGVSLHDEFDLLIQAGLTPVQVLRTATINAAHALGQEGEFGRIQPGQRADLLLIDGDPTSEIELLRRPSIVVAAGRVYDAHRLDRLWQSAGLTDAERTARNVMEAMVAQGTKIDLRMQGVARTKAKAGSP